MVTSSHKQLALNIPLRRPPSKLMRLFPRRLDRGDEQFFCILQLHYLLVVTPRVFTLWS